MKVAVMWWQMSSGGTQQAIRGNVKAFDDVDLYLGNEVERLEECASEYDFVLTPFVHYDRNLEAYDDTHLHLQFGGYPSEAQIKKTQRMVNYVDSMSALDPSILTDFYCQHLDIDLNNVSLIPNPPNWELFDSRTFESSDASVMIPKVGSEQKNVGEVTEMAKAARTEHFKMNYVGDSRIDMPDNVTPMPRVPFTEMPSRYEDSLVVANPSTLDVLPNTAYEAFLSHRPYVCRTEALGDVQSIPASELDPDEFGMSVQQWLDEHTYDINDGDHFMSGDNGTALGNHVFKLMTDLELWHDVTDAADKWLYAWARWNWKDKGELLLDEL
jgi:hypothetical protein